jgi:hypothetical protein
MRWPRANSAEVVEGQDAAVVHLPEDVGVEWQQVIKRACVSKIPSGGLRASERSAIVMRRNGYMAR